MLILNAIAFEQSSDLLPINCLCLVIKDQVAKQRSKLSKHVAFTMGCQNNSHTNIKSKLSIVIFSQDVDNKLEAPLCANIVNMLYGSLL